MTLKENTAFENLKGGSIAIANQLSRLVPYHAKDSPATRAEFSHPDATIVLTCLSYYYGGLSDQQIYASFEALLQFDHAPEEYARWVQDAPELPPAFRQITGINLNNVG